MILTPLDFLILLALVIGVIRGFMTGAARQVISIFGVIVAVILSIELMNPVGHLVGSALGIPEAIRPAIGIVVVFVLVEVAAFFVTRSIEALIKALRLNFANRALGGAVGLAKAGLILSILFVVLAFFDVPESEDRRMSTLYPYVARALPVAWDYMSEQLPVIRSLSGRIGDEAREVLEGRSSIEGEERGQETIEKGTTDDDEP